MKNLAFLLIVLVSTAVAVPAQVKKYSYGSELCQNEGFFDSKLYTAKQIENTRLLFDGNTFDLDSFDAAAFTIEAIPKLLTVGQIEADYRKKLAALEKLDIVRVPYWQEFKRKKIVEIGREFELAKASVQSYTNPSALREVTYAPACVTRFAKPLIDGGDALLASWLGVNIDLRKKNGSPEDVRRKYEAQLASDRRLDYARLEVTTFGWWNCVNDKIDRGDFTVATTNFKKLFRRFRTFNCDEP